MKPAYEERNNRIRRIYEKRIIELKRQGERKYLDIAVNELVHQFNAWELSYETIKEIVLREDYGERWVHVQVLEGNLWIQFLEGGEPVKARTEGGLKKDLKRLKKAHPGSKFRVAKMPPPPETSGAAVGAAGFVPPDAPASSEVSDQTPGSAPEVGEKVASSIFPQEKQLFFQR
jgi:hypothetical protein